MAKGYRVQTSRRVVPTESRVWVGEEWVRCRVCNSTGERDTAHGLDVCEACGGRGEIEDVRRGASCCRTLEDLRSYLAARQWNRKGCVVVEITGEPSPDQDWDADEGAILICNARISRVLTLREAGL